MAIFWVHVQTDFSSRAPKALISEGMEAVISVPRMCFEYWARSGVMSFSHWTRSKAFWLWRLAFWIANILHGTPRHELVGIAAGVACILGHTFPVWLRFRGGKGVATSAGVLLGLMPIAVVSVFLVWLLLFKTTRYVSVASIGGAVSLPLFVMLYLRFNMLTGASLLPFSVLIAGVVVWRHRSNIQRLLRGQEERFSRR